MKKLILINNTNENKEDEKEKEMEEPKSEEQNKPEELKEDSNSKSLNKKEEKQKKLFLKYLPNNINTDKENESCSQKQEPRENKYRELITPGSDITISNKRFQRGILKRNMRCLEGASSNSIISRSEMNCIFLFNSVIEDFESIVSLMPHFWYIFLSSNDNWLVSRMM